MKIKYIPKAFRNSSMEIIDGANEILEEYAEEGYILTLRQLYYQFVSRSMIENSQKEYNRIGAIINDARLAGEIDWEAIEDRTRNLQSLSHWDSPKQVLEFSIKLFKLDKWENQYDYVEVWIEKEALTGVIEKTCQELDVPFIATKGYMSQSEMWSAANRFREWNEGAGTYSYILHLGDHDPSGIDMTLDISNRLNNVYDVEIEVERIALNMDQIEQYNPPPNPAKVTDSRYNAYREQFGDESWELDALPPVEINKLLAISILKHRDEDKYADTLSREWEMIKQLKSMIRNIKDE